MIAGFVLKRLSNFQPNSRLSFLLFRRFFIRFLLWKAYSLHMDVYLDNF
jgi:hypothetical protein